MSSATLAQDLVVVVECSRKESHLRKLGSRVLNAYLVRTLCRVLLRFSACPFLTPPVFQLSIQVSAPAKQNRLHTDLQGRRIEKAQECYRAAKYMVKLLELDLKPKYVEIEPVYSILLLTACAETFSLVSLSSTLSL